MCVVCKHPRRPEIDAALSSGMPHREIARRFALAVASIGRHRAHLRAGGGEATAVALTRAFDALGREPSPLELLRADLEDIRWSSHPHDYRAVANLAHAAIAHLRPRVREYERELRADVPADAHDVAADLSDLVDTLRSEVGEAPAGRPRAAVAGALASAEALLRRVGGAPAYTDPATVAELAALAEAERQLRAEFVAAEGHPS